MPAVLNQNPLLTLDALAPCGVVLPTEVSAALDTSLSLKARELGVQRFLFWGRLSTLSGKDYYVARAYNGTKRVDGKVVVAPGNKFYYSQDGVNWLDLEPVAGVQAEKAVKLDGASCEINACHPLFHQHRDATHNKITPARACSPPSCQVSLSVTVTRTRRRASRASDDFFRDGMGGQFFFKTRGQFGHGMGIRDFFLLSVGGTERERTRTLP
jgi:hypothetical protein